MTGFPIPTEKLEYRHYIDGSFSESSDGGKFELRSPYNDEKIIDICEASVEDTNRAVAAAKAAFPAWSAKSPVERGALLKSLSAKVKEAERELAQLNAMDMGRPVGVDASITMDTPQTLIDYRFHHTSIAGSHPYCSINTRNRVTKQRVPQV